MPSRDPLKALRPHKRRPLRSHALTLAISLALPALAPAQSGQETQPTRVEPVEVKAKKPQQDGYLGSKTRVGKIEQDPHEVPQAITTVTAELLEAQQASSFREAMRNVSAVSFNAAEGGRSGDNINLRGFYTFGDVYLDGIRDTAQYNRETFNLEQIDVLRGAGAMLFGRGQAGGVINQVTKLPQAFERYKIVASGGSYDYGEFTADLNKPLGAHMGLRVNLMHREEGNWRRNPVTLEAATIRRKGMGLSFAFAPAYNSRFWLNHYDYTTHDRPDYGISFDPNTRRPSERLPAWYWWGGSRTFDMSDTRITTLIHEHRFGTDTTLRTQVRNAQYDRSYWAKTPNLTTPPTAVLNVGGNPTRASNYETVTVQSDLSTRFELLGAKHQLLAGAELLKERAFRHSLLNRGGTTFTNPPAFVPYVISTTGSPVRFRGESWSAYAQDTARWTRNWETTLGVRRDWLDATYSSLTSPRLKYEENSYRAALSYHVDESTHYYAAWSDSFSPTADLYQLTVKPLPPERSQVVELGSKWLLGNGDWALRAAVYQAVKNWERNADLESTAAILTRKRRTRGIEFELAGRLTPQWEIFSGLAIMDARILVPAINVNAITGALTSANPELAGKQARNTPRYTFNLWTTYKLTPQWTVGGGLTAVGKRYGYSPTTTGALPTLPNSTAFHPNTAPAYAKFDLMASYEQERWAVRLNIKNVSDKLYFDSIYDNGGFAIPGPRRSAILSAELKF